MSVRGFHDRQLDTVCHPVQVLMVVASIYHREAVLVFRGRGKIRYGWRIGYEAGVHLCEGGVVDVSLAVPLVRAVHYEVTLTYPDPVKVYIDIFFANASRVRLVVIGYLLRASFAVEGVRVRCSLGMEIPDPLKGAVDMVGIHDILSGGDFAGPDRAVHLLRLF